MTDAATRGEVRRFARAHGFCDDEDVLETCQAKVAGMGADMASWSPEEGDDRGRPAADPYNALLAVYDPPRTESTDGPLTGMTLAIKDHIAVEGLSMTAGLAEFSYVPDYDALLVERLLEAGATIVGKANMDALAIGPEGVWSERGEVRSAIADDRVPGGSSSGSAVAVATRQVDAAIGTDAGGSIRKPAAYNELVGVKPSRGLVPSHGKVLTQTTLGATGPIARTVADAAAVLEVIAGPDRRDPGVASVDLGSLTNSLDDPLDGTIGIPDSFVACADPPVREVFEALTDDIVDRTDCTMRDVALDNQVSRLAGYLSGAEFRWLLEQGGVNHGPGVASDPAWHALVGFLQEAGLNEHVTLRKLPSAVLDEVSGGRSYVAAHEGMIAFQRELDELFDKVDLLLTPTVPALPPPRSADIENFPRNLSINCQPFNLGGVPSVAVPAGRSEGLPVSAQVTAPLFADALALRGARVIEQLRS